MNISRTMLGKVIPILLISIFVLVACSSKFAASVRKVTYPPDFKYTSKSDLRTDMQKLAFQMSLLEQALNAPNTQTQNEVELQREQVLSALTKMGRITANLQAGNAGANHPFMDDYMQGLTAKIDQARTAASLPTPRYYFAGKVSGACVNCHKVNR